MKKFFILVLLLAIPAVIPTGTQAATKPHVKGYFQVMASVSCPGGALHCGSLTWVAPTGGAVPTGYNVYRTTTNNGCSTVSATGCTKLTSSPVTTTSYVDSPLSASTTYYYVATALDASGESSPSNQASLTTSADPVPNPPTGLTVSGQ